MQAYDHFDDNGKGIISYYLREDNHSYFTKKVTKIKIVNVVLDYRPLRVVGTQHATEENLRIFQSMCMTKLD